MVLNATFNNYYSYIVAKTGVPGVSHWQSSTPGLNRIRTHNVNCIHIPNMRNFKVISGERCLICFTYWRNSDKIDFYKCIVLPSPFLHIKSYTIITDNSCYMGIKSCNQQLPRILCRPVINYHLRIHLPSILCIKKMQQKTVQTSLSYNYPASFVF
jgi:hypothetical protein